MFYAEATRPQSLCFCLFLSTCVKLTDWLQNGAICLCIVFVCLFWFIDHWLAIDRTPNSVRMVTTGEQTLSFVKGTQRAKGENCSVLWYLLVNFMLTTVCSIWKFIESFKDVFVRKWSCHSSFSVCGYGLGWIRKQKSDFGQGIISVRAGRFIKKVD